MCILYGHELSCFFNSCPWGNIGTSNLDLRLATITFHNIDHRVAWPDRRPIRSCGRSLLPEPVWRRERKHPSGSCTGGVRSAADIVLAWLLLDTQCVQEAAPWTLRWCAVYTLELPRGHCSREPPIGFREEPGVSCVLCVVLCPLMIQTQVEHFPAPLLQHNLSSARRPPMVASVQLPHMDL